MSGRATRFGRSDHNECDNHRVIETTRDTPELLTVPETARLLRCSRTAVYRLINGGHITAVRASPESPWRVPRAQLLRDLGLADEQAGAATHRKGVGTTP